jgi:hypothetical protein
MRPCDSLLSMSASMLLAEHSLAGLQRALIERLGLWVALGLMEPLWLLISTAGPVDPPLAGGLLDAREQRGLRKRVAAPGPVLRREHDDLAVKILHQR